MRIIAYLFSIITLIEGILLSMENTIFGGRMTIEPTIDNIVLSFLFSISCFIFARYYTKFIKKEIYSKCPECKETYDYSKLKKGICTKCNIKTIGMEKYYDNNTKI